MFRLRGHYFAIGTWVMAEVFRLLAAQTSALGGGSGTSLPASLVVSIAEAVSLGIVEPPREADGLPVPRLLGVIADRKGSRKPAENGRLLGLASFNEPLEV
jgi:hypothetical protein